MRGFSVDEVAAAGVLPPRRNGSHRQILTPGNQVAAGAEIFRVECQSCHTAMPIGE